MHHLNPVSAGRRRCEIAKSFCSEAAQLNRILNRALNALNLDSIDTMNAAIYAAFTMQLGNGLQSHAVDTGDLKSLAQ